MIDTKQIKDLLGLKLIASHANITERQAYNLINGWKKKVSKMDEFLLKSVINERIEELERLRRCLNAPSVYPDTKDERQ